jgi:ferredoxin-NADP reductase/CRP-like cAMP-binding protein
MSIRADDIVRSGLLGSVSEVELEALLSKASRWEVPAGGLIMREAELGNECYVILSGSVQVFTQGKDDRVFVLDRREPGAVIGEQALLPGSTGRRNASLRALTDVSLLRITREQFLDILTRDHSLKEKLRRIGDEQARDNLLHQSAVFSSLHLGDGDGDWHREETFSDGEVIFRQGDIGDKVYLVIDGIAGVYEEKVDGHRSRLLGVGPGRTVGEMALVNKKPRSATVIAESELKVISINGHQFLKMQAQYPEVREYMQTLNKVFALGQQSIGTQYLGRFNWMDCLTTVASLIDGVMVTSSLVIGQDIFNMAVVMKDDTAVNRVRYQDTQRGINRELMVEAERIVGVASQGQWEELGKVYRMVLERTILEADQLDLFRQDGTLQRVIQLPLYQDDEVVCDCLQLQRGALRRCFEAGAHTVEKLGEATGAGNTCGGCRPLLKQMVGQADWLPVEVAEVIPCNEKVRSYRFKSTTNGELPLSEARPGQHVVIQANIEGRWIQRPYTISSAAQETDYREITVKKEPQGLFSGWLFDGRYHNTMVRISEPQGDYHADLSQPDTIVCLVGGIGMTPALAICRSIISSGKRQTLAIDYSVSTRDQFIYADELQNAATGHDNIRVNLRATREQGRIGKTDIDKFLEDYPDAQYYICGSSDYQDGVEDLLKAAAVPPERVHLEVFTPVGIRPVTPSLNYFYLGLVFLVLFATQDLLHLKLPWLEALQAQGTYKIWSGLLLTLYIACQFMLPAVRWTHRVKDTVHYYNLHKIQGVFAPLIYFIHSTTIGFAYLSFLSAAYFSNVLVGLFNHEVVVNPERKQQFARYWLAAHVLFSVLTIALLVVHLYVVISFR